MYQLRDTASTGWNLLKDGDREHQTSNADSFFDLTIFSIVKPLPGRKVEPQ